MESPTQRRPKVRRAKNFVVEENIDAIGWPQECSGCGDSVDRTDTIKLKKTYKAYGEVNVEVAGIPYCATCFGKSRAANRLDKVVWALAILLGVPLGFVLLAMQYAQRQSSSGSTIIFLGLIFLFAIAICYGLVWLVVKRPIRSIYKDRFIDPISAWLIEEKKSDGREGLSVVIAVPNKAYADKFALLNGATA